MKKLQVIELDNRRLLTTEQLAEIYEATAKNIQDNFQNNKANFIEGKHYHRLIGEELKVFKNYPENIGLVDKRAPQLILWTKQGAGRHSKILNTDKAWDMFDVLEENYFNPKQPVPLTIREQAILALAANEETNVRVDQIESDIQEIKDNSLITTEDKSSIDRLVRKRVSAYCSDQRLNQEAKSMLFQDIGRSIKELFNVPHRGRIKSKDYQTAIEFLNSWEPTAVTKAKIKQLDLFDDQDIA